MKKYKILLIVRHPVGGIRTFFKYFYRNYDPEKYSFTLVSPDTPETQVLLNDICKLDVAYLSTNNWLSNKEFFVIITNIIINNKFDLIHSHGFTAGVCSVFGSLLRSIPHILTCHDVFTEKQFVGLGGFVKKLFLSLMLSMIDNIHCVSHDARSNLLEYLPILKVFNKKIVVILNGIETEHFFSAKERDIRNEFGLKQHDFLIGFLGRFMSQKGFFYLIEALEEIKKNGNPLKQPIVLCFSPEDGFIREEKENISKRGLTESVLFLPYVADVASTLKSLDVVVIPSLWEACPLLPMEAMVAGVPLIGTNCVGLREVLKDTPATVVPARNSMALAIALLKEMKKPSISAKEFSKMAVTQFDVKRRAIELENLMLKYLEK